MRGEWPLRWTGAACAVAGCMPMLFALVAGVAGATAAQGMAMTMSGPMGAQPVWVTDLGTVSWPLLLVSAGLLVWSFARTAPRARAVAYVGVAGLIINQLNMTPWVFFPAMALVVAGFWLGRRGGAMA